MLVFWEAKLVFLATPKTGSTSIAQALESQAAISIQRPPLLKHSTVHRYRRFFGPYLEAASKTDWTVCALMREPRDWLNSWYRFRSREGQNDPERSTKGMSFDDFVRGWCQDQRPAFADVGSQAKFLRPRKDQGVDRLFRYEDMPRFIAFLQESLGQKVELPLLNVSPKGESGLSPATEALLQEKAAEDYALYDSIA